MGYPTKVQLIKRKTSRQWYVNFPAVLAQAMEFAKGEVVEWVVEDRTTLTPRRTTLVGRIRKDAKLFHPPDDADQPVVGAKRKYGEQAPTPEMLRRKQKGGITHCWKKGQTPVPALRAGLQSEAPTGQVKRELQAGNPRRLCHRPSSASVRRKLLTATPT